MIIQLHYRGRLIMQTVRERLSKYDVASVISYEGK